MDLVALGKDFAAAVAGPDSEVDLFGAAMVMARIGGGPANAESVARQIDLIAESAMPSLGQRTDACSLAQ